MAVQKTSPWLGTTGFKRNSNSPKAYQKYGQLASQKKSIDHIAVMQSAGVELRHTGGGRLRGLCPFHEERTPSFFVYPDGRFHCFGCHEDGDIIDFIRKLYNFSFADSLRHLGLHSGPLTQVDRKAIEKEQRRQKLVKAFRRWESIYVDELSLMIRTTKKTLRHNGNDIIDRDPDFYGWLLDELTLSEYRLEVLTHGSDHDKIAVYREIGPRAHDPRPAWERQAVK